MLQFCELFAGASLTLFERLGSPPTLVAKRFLLDGAPHGGWQTGKVALGNVIVDAVLDAFDGGFFAKSAGDQQEGDFLS